MYGGLPNTGLNLSTPIYALVALIMLIASGVVAVIDKMKSVQ